MAVPLQCVWQYLTEAAALDTRRAKPAQTTPRAAACSACLRWAKHPTTRPGGGPGSVCWWPATCCSVVPPGVSYGTDSKYQYSLVAPTLHVECIPVAACCACLLSRPSGAQTALVTRIGTQCLSELTCHCRIWRSYLLRRLGGQLVQGAVPSPASTLSPSPIHNHQGATTQQCS